MNLRERATRLKTDVPAVFLALRHPQTPWTVKMLAALTVVYALSPVDLIPDFVPVLGYLDDVLLLPALVAATVKQIPPQVMDECRAQAQNLWQDGRPTRWYYAIPIVLLWMLVLWLAYRAIAKKR